MAKNVLQKVLDEQGNWVEVHPITKSINVYNIDGKTVQEQIDELKESPSSSITVSATQPTSDMWYKVIG